MAEYEGATYPQEDTNYPVHSRTKEISWQVESQLANELLSDLGWWRQVIKTLDDNGNIKSYAVTWVKFGKYQMVSEYGANKLFMHLKVFLGHELPLTKWTEDVIKNTIIIHLDDINESIHFDPLMGARIADFGTINEILKTVFREQAYKAREGWTMKIIGEDKKVVEHIRRDGDQTSMMPWSRGGNKND